MHSEITEQQRRHYLQLLDIDIYPELARSAISLFTQQAATANAAAATGPEQPLQQPAATAQTTAQSAHPRASGRSPSTAAEATTDSTQAASYSHDCLLLCDDKEHESLLLDILRHLPTLAAADDEFLRSHIVTARQLAALRPRLLLTTSSTALTAAVDDYAQRLDIDLQQLQSDPLRAKPALWQQLQALANTDHSSS